MCQNCGWSETQVKIQEILDTGKAGSSATSFLESVHEWVEEHEHVTEAQSKKVEEIADRVGA